MKKLLLATAVFLATTASSAMQIPDSLGICYLFEGKGSTAQPCVVSFGETARGQITALQFGGKAYVQEDWYEGKTTLNDKPATYYIREGIFFEVTTQEEAEELGWDHLLSCMKSSEVDICYFLPQPQL